MCENYMSEKNPPSPHTGNFFCKKLDFKPLFYVYFKNHFKKAGFLKNLSNFVNVLTGVGQRPS